MNQFDVYAIGHALLDIEYHAEPSRLTELGIDKGVMTLIDEQRQNSLVAQLGESHEKMTCGGSAANTIIALAQLGAQTHFDCRIASDMAGQVFSHDLHDSGVHTSLDLDLEHSGITGKCLVFVTPDADRSMNTFLGVSESLAIENVSEEAIRHSKYVYLEGYLASADNTRDAAIEARKLAERHKVKTALTLSDPNMVRFFRDSMLAMIGDGVDLLFANEEEILDFAQTDSLDKALDAVHKVARHFAITRGAEGALVYDGISLIEIAPHAVDAIDTLGAGDMFAGAFLYGLTQDMSYTQSGNLASAASAEIVTRFGPRLDKAATQSVLQRFKAGI